MLPLGLVVLGVVVLLAGWFAGRRVIRSRNMQYWIRSYLAWKLSRVFHPRPAAPARLFLLRRSLRAVRGHEGPGRRAHERVRVWMEKYPALAGVTRDSFGRHPEHTFFYPIEEYDPDADRCARGAHAPRGFGDVEVHLHHDNDTAENLRAHGRPVRRGAARTHGLLQREPTPGQVIYAFIHGNWALDNSRPDGRWCGVDNEIQILIETGCYADLTMPSAPSDTQTSKINSIYFAARPGLRKSHDTGQDSARRPVGRGPGSCCWSRAP